MSENASLDASCNSSYSLSSISSKKIIESPISESLRDGISHLLKELEEIKIKEEEIKSEECQKKLKEISHLLDFENICANDLSGDEPYNQMCSLRDDLFLFIKECSEPEKNKLTKILEQLNKDINFFKEIYDLTISDDKNTQNLSTQIQTRLGELKVGEKCIFPGGYSGFSKPGHAIVYEVCYEGENKYSFKVINSGSGLLRHHELAAGGKYHTLMYKNISLEQLDEKFWNTLIDFQINPKPESVINSVYGPIDAIYSFLDSNLKTKNNKTYGISHSPQIGGNCSYKSLSLWCHEQISTLDKKTRRVNVQDQSLYNKFKLFRLEKKLELLQDSVLKHHIENQVVIYKRSETIQKIAQSAGLFGNLFTGFFRSLESMHKKTGASIFAPHLEEVKPSERVEFIEKNLKNKITRIKTKQENLDKQLNQQLKQPTSSIKTPIQNSSFLK